MSEVEHAGPSTLCVHAGDERDPLGALNRPLYAHSTFGFGSTEDLVAVVEGRADGAFYTRYGSNPTVIALEEKLARLEGAEAALAFGSGMAAMSAAVLSCAGAGDGVLCIGGVYGGTDELVRHRLPELGVAAELAPEARDGAALAGRLDGVRAVVLESPTNPRLDVVDIASVAEAAHRAGAAVIVDNTFATPINQNPLLHGADLVVHSATKYLGGHSDLTGGAVAGPRPRIDAVAPWRRALGQIVAPQVAFLLQRSLRTLAVRVEAHNGRAREVAAVLARHPRVREVLHPSLAAGPEAEVVARQMRGPGGMVGFTYAGGADETAAMIDRLRLFAIAPSLGGVESLVTQPATTSHRDLSEEERERQGVTGGLVRLSVGIEDARDLVADLERAL